MGRCNDKVQGRQRHDLGSLGEGRDSTDTDFPTSVPLL
jgi:hypothetical protein